MAGDERVAASFGNGVKLGSSGNVGCQRGGRGETNMDGQDWRSLALHPAHPVHPCSNFLLWGIDEHQFSPSLRVGTERQRAAAGGNMIGGQAMTSPWDATQAMAAYNGITRIDGSQGWHCRWGSLGWTEKLWASPCLVPWSEGRGLVNSGCPCFRFFDSPFADYTLQSRSAFPPLQRWQRI